MSFKLNRNQKIVCWIAASVIAAIQLSDFLENGINSYGWVFPIAIAAALIVIALTSNDNEEIASRGNLETTPHELISTRCSIPPSQSHGNLTNSVIDTVQSLARIIRNELVRINPGLASVHPSLNALVGPRTRSLIISYCMVFIAFNSNQQFFSRSKLLRVARDLMVEDVCRNEAARLSAELDSDEHRIESMNSRSANDSMLRNELMGLNAAKITLLRTTLNNDLQELEVAGRLAISSFEKGASDGLLSLGAALRRFMLGNKIITPEQFNHEYGPLVKSWIALAQDQLSKESLGT